MRVRGRRLRELALVRTLCNARVYSLGELRVHHARWQAEVDLRSIKIITQMDVLRGKTPDMVQKEIWMHLLAYKLIRTVMAEAAERARLRPREVCIKGELQTLTGYRLLLEQATERELPSLYDAILDAIVSHRVGNRPHRYEPRAIKQRPKARDLLTIPCAEPKCLFAG